MSHKIYQIVTDRIIERIEETGYLPWQKPWAQYLSAEGGPQNMISKKPYRGINSVLLDHGETPFWLSFKQAEKLGGRVKKGEHGTPCVFWLWGEKSDAKGNTKKTAVMRYYTVFNLSQCEGIESPKTGMREANGVESLAQCDALIAGYSGAPKITHNEARAYYAVDEDRVNMPLKDSFKSAVGYYATMFHELGHSTGHAKRLARHEGNESWGKFGSDPYAKEELVAELTSSYLCAHAGILDDNLDQSTSYLAGWIKQFKSDPKLIVSAASQAQKAADLILGKQAEEKEAE